MTHHSFDRADRYMVNDPDHPEFVEPVVYIFPLHHRAQACIGLKFSPKNLVKIISRLPGIKYSKTNTCYYLLKDKKAYHFVKKELEANHIKIVIQKEDQNKFPTKDKGLIKKTTTNISQSKNKLSSDRSSYLLDNEILKELDIFKDYLLSKRYSPSTIKTYISMLKKFFSYMKEPIESINSSHVVKFNTEYILANNYSPTYQNQVVSAIKLFYDKRMNVSLEIEDLERPRKGRVLPKVISKEKVKDFIESIDNTKHRTFFLMIYALGLRVGEATSLEIRDIDEDNLTIKICNGKGKKDRMLPLSMNLLMAIKKYLIKYRPNKYVFEGALPGSHITKSSMSKVFKKKMKRVIPNNRYTIHSLRHSFATHNLEAGVDLRYIQELLGHKSSRTTEIYTYVSIRELKNIRNITDDWQI